MSFRISALPFLLLVAAPTRAQLRVEPGVRMTQLQVRVEVVDGVATTTLHQTWHNDGGVQAEATWLLPLPAGAVADGFTLTVNGVPQSGEVLGANEARGVYEGIVRRRRDPGLLEFFGRGCLRARIFPIPAQGDSVADVTFRQVLPETLGLRRWSLAIGAAGAEGLAPEKIVLDLALHSRKAIKNAYAPLQAIQVIQKDDHEVRASLEGSSAALGGELAVFYGLSEAEFGLDLLTQRKASDPEGTFLLLVSPKREWQQAETLKKSIVFVLDTSGSMEGAKIAQAKSALKLFLQSLTSEDRFDVVPFATEAQPFFGERVPASAEKVAEALARVEGLAAAGGTNIAGALERALRGASADGRVPIVVFLTDGEPTVGETGPQKILAAAQAENAQHARVFVLGVGADLNTHLLDELAAENGGARDYVRAGERIDEKGRTLFAKLAHPVMSELALSIDGLAPTQVVPEKLPDLFLGDRLEVFGRYSGEGAHAIRLSGVVGGARREYVYEGTFPREAPSEQAFLAPLWAERRVGVLLDAIRLNGTNPELVNEIQRLGREYRIVTPYTSHLVVEPGLRVAGIGSAGGSGPATGPAGPTSPGPGTPRALERDLKALGYGGGANETGSDGWFRGPSDTIPPIDALAAQLSQAGVLPADATPDQRVQLARLVVEELRASERRWSQLGDKVSGEQAVDESQYLAQLMARGAAKSGSKSSILELFTRRVQDKAFALRAGRWVDASLGETPPAPGRSVEAFSSEYFALLAEKPALAIYFALSQRLLVALDGQVYEVRAPGG